jgi:hypothetical protein
MGLWDRLHKEDEAAVGGPTVAEGVALARSRPQEVWGRPSRCPECGEAGYLDKVDVNARIQHEHCTSCFHKWSVAESETIHADA